MQIYVGHSTTLDYKHQLYQPLKNSVLFQQYTFILPHETNKKPMLSKNIIKGCDLVLAEVSYPSTGLGIELGWAEIANRPILCCYQKHTQPSLALNMVCSEFIPYDKSEDLINKLSQWLMGKKAV